MDLTHLNRFGYPLLVGFGIVAGFHSAELVAPFLNEVTEDTALALFDESAWQVIGRIVLVFYGAVAGGVSYKNYDFIADLRLIHRLTYFHFQGDIVTPGSVWGDVLWSLLYAVFSIGVVVLSCLSALFLMIAAFVENVFLGILALFLAAPLVQPVMLALIDVIHEVFRPKRLERELKHAGLFLKFLHAHRQELAAIARQGGDPRQLCQPLSTDHPKGDSHD